MTAASIAYFARQAAALAIQMDAGAVTHEDARDLVDMLGQAHAKAIALRPKVRRRAPDRLEIPEAEIPY